MRYRHVWKTEVRRCVDRIGRPEFSLADVYRYKDELQVIFPLSKNIESRIRENLQLLRDDGYLEFVDNQGNYRRLR